MKKQIKNVLPRSEWLKTTIIENNDPLVEIKETKRLKTGLISKSYYSPFRFVRKTVAEKLYKVSESLPKELNLVLIEGYRTIASQLELWDHKMEKTRKENSLWTEEQVEQQVRLLIAKPSPLANHHCGGAVDITLAYSNGTLVDMGTPYPSESMNITEWCEKFNMLSNEITPEQIKNRKILRDAMEKQGFVWYPAEWWHYCFGDRMWAVYSRQLVCSYGPIEL